MAKLNKKIHIELITKAQALAKGGNHQGMILKFSEFNYTPLKQIKKDMNFIVVLDGLTDVGNIEQCNELLILGEFNHCIKYKNSK